MNREELESRSKPELIDLILQQQILVAQLQSRAAELQAQLAQLQLSSRNGEAEKAALPEAPVGRFPLALKLILIAGLVLVCGIVLIVAGFRPGALIDVGAAKDYPPGSVTAMQLPASNRGDQAIPVFLVNNPASGFLALYARDPGSNCLLVWQPAVGRIEDPCSGSKYTRSGESIGGPAPRGLDRYAVSLTESGEIKVDVSTLQTGPSRPQ